MEKHVSNQYCIKEIYSIDTLDPRQDKKSLSIKGSRVRLLVLGEGVPCWMFRVSDSEGNQVGDVITTSSVQTYSNEDEKLRIVTVDSIYRLMLINK